MWNNYSPIEASVSFTRNVVFNFVERVSEPDDDVRVERNREKEKDAMKICQEKIKKHNLDMKLIDAEYT